MDLKLIEYLSIFKYENDQIIEHLKNIYSWYFILIKNKLFKIN